MNCVDCPPQIKYISDANSTTKMADMNNTIDINQAESEILLSLNETLITKYHDGNEHVFGPGKTHEFETEIDPDNICLGMIYPLASITHIYVPLLIIKMV